MRASIFVMGSLLMVATEAGSQVLGLNDLIGARAAGAEQEMTRRGYVNRGGSQGVDRSYTNWWNRSNQTCVTVATMNGRYASITPTPAPDCQRNAGDRPDRGTPEITVSRRGDGRVMINRNCNVYYDQRGARHTALPGCSNRERRQADDAMARYRREQGLDRRPVQNWDGAASVIPLRNGNLEVIMQRGCAVFFRPNGTLLSSLSTCTRTDRAVASIAVLRYRRGQRR